MPRTTKQTYELVARIIAGQRNTDQYSGGEERRDALDALTEDFAAAFGDERPQFDRARFLDAAKYGEF